MTFIDFGKMAVNCKCGERLGMQATGTLSFTCLHSHLLETW